MRYSCLTGRFTFTRFTASQPKAFKFTVSGPLIGNVWFPYLVPKWMYRVHWSCTGSLRQTWNKTQVKRWRRIVRRELFSNEWCSTKTEDTILTSNTTDAKHTTNTTNQLELEENASEWRQKTGASKGARKRVRASHDHFWFYFYLVETMAQVFFNQLQSVVE